MPRTRRGRVTTSIASVILLTMLMVMPSALIAADDGPRTSAAMEEAERKARAAAMFLGGTHKATADQTTYDALYYDLDLTMDPVITDVSGTVTLRATPTAASITSIDLDLLNNFTVSAVRVDGGAAVFSHAGNLISVTLGGSFAPGDTFTVEVDYSGTPNEAYGAFGFDSFSGSPMIWSLSEPYGARSWWPCKDLPEDKPDSVDIRIRVPSNLIVASNGTLRDTTIAAGWTTYNWHENYPIATYLVSVAIHPYSILTDWYNYSPTDSMPIQHYIFPGHVGSVGPQVSMTAEMIEHFSSLFGEYPFVDEKYGHAEFLWGGGMEHQTISSMGFFGESIVAHELAHQWWGDKITCNTFNHIWLNEGFATYSEALWDDYKYGRAAYKQTMRNAAYYGPGTIYVEDPNDFNEIFDSNLSYNKASWVLHMLRHIVDDTMFFDILQAYYADPGVEYGTATTEQFRTICETVSGMDFEAFFDQWIYDEYFPIYSFDWSYVPGGGGYDIDLTINQKQTHRVFKMPIDVRVYFAGSKTAFVVQDTLATQNFTIHVDLEPVSIELDATEWILKGVQEGIDAPTFDRGILVVNGVDWGVYGTEISSAYEDSVFWGGYPISFWDCFGAPGGGYPSNLPLPLGQGMVPSDTLEQFSTVVWVGNNYNGDLTKWINTAMLDYLEAGGNVVLLSRMGEAFLYSGMRDYLGISWNGEETLGNCTSTYPGLVSMSFTGTQSFGAIFDTVFATGETELLFRDTSSNSPLRGTGAWRNPASGGTHRADGGKLAFVSGRPYRMSHSQLRSNVEFILGNLLNEPFDPTGVDESPAPGLAWTLEANRPNPFNPVTEIAFAVPEKSRVRIDIFDPAGRLVRTLLDEDRNPGRHSVNWNGKDQSGRSIASGIYFYRLESGDVLKTRKMVLIR